MKLLIATRPQDDGSFDADEGELVVPESCTDCVNELGAVFRGLESEGHALTAQVVNRGEVDLKAFVLRAAGSYESHRGILRLADDETEMRLVARELCRMIERAQELSAGSLVRRDGLKLRVIDLKKVP